MDCFYRAASVADACDRLAGDDGVQLIAGGQTLTLLLRQGLTSPDRLVDISRIEELSEIVDRGESVSIGSAVTYETLRTSPIIRTEFPSFASAIDHIAGPQVRANGTIGGGLCYGDPALDAPPVLLALDADVTLQSSSARRTLPLSEFFTGYFETALQPDELLVDVTVPKLPPNAAGSYRTMAPRQGDYAIAGVAVSAAFEGATCTKARIGLANGGERPKRAVSAESVVEGSELEAPTVERAVEALGSDLDLIGDAQVSQSYQETVFERLAAQALDDVAGAVDRGSGDGEGEVGGNDGSGGRDERGRDR